MVFVPTQGGGADPSHIGLAFETVWLETEDAERLHGWFIANPEPATRTVLFLHGNAGNISHRLDTVRLLLGLGLNVFIIDYRGYGLSSGVPSELAIELDALAAWQYLVHTRGIAASRIVVHGRSLGGAIALGLITQVTPAALIVESTFTSIPDMAAELYPWLPVRWLARIHYPNRERIAARTCPVLIAHSEGDRLVPFAHGQALYAAAAEPKMFLRMRGGHNEGFLDTGEAYVLALRRFIDTHVAE
ncbi:MAG: alpha/beta fold hydrolase [Gammaproteobacteria bacterium]|nr:alpha/beta fold hydrolase [Gammaproteobacteria bacterium]